MRFEKVKGRQVVDVSRDLILTEDPDIASAKIKSHGPSLITGGRHITNCGKLGLRGRFWASVWALKFIWSEH
jgi:hypothetical protein